MNIVEPFFRRALLQAEAPALIAGERVVTYGRLMQDTLTVASRLCEESVQPGDVVAVLASDLLSHVLFTFAIARAGAVSVPFLNIGSDDARAEAARIAPRFLVHNQSGTLPPPAPGRKDLSLRELAAVKPSHPLPPISTRPADLCCIAFSSGTTGRTKAIKFSHHATVLRTVLVQTVFPSGPSDRTMVLDERTADRRVGGRA
jgi:acyl-coenzyme A synthetase/AMP-(fatty) acid ligase